MTGRPLRILVILILVSPLHAAPIDGSDRERLSLRALNGAPRSLEELTGTIVVLNFWATWCVPCREEMPLLAEIQSEYISRGVEFVAASTDEPGQEKQVRRFVRGEKIGFQVWVGGTVADMLRLGLGDALPATAVIDAEGNIRFRILGLVTRELLEERLDFLLDDRTGEAPESLVDSFGLPGPDGQVEAHDHDEHHDHGHDHDHGDEEGDDSLVPS